GPDLHRGAPRVRLHAAATAACALCPALFHDHVADLARRPAPKPGLAVDHDPTADPRPPEDAEHGAVPASGAELGLRVHRDLHVLGPARRRRRQPRLPADLPAAVDDDGLDLRSAEVDPAPGLDAHGCLRSGTRTGRVYLLDGGSTSKRATRSPWVDNGNEG